MANPLEDPKANESKSEELLTTAIALKQIRKDIAQRLDLTDQLETLVVLGTYLITECKSDYRKKLRELEKRKNKLIFEELPQDQMMVELNAMNKELKEIASYQENLMTKLNFNKIETTEQLEELIFQLDFYYSQLQMAADSFHRTLEIKEYMASPSELELIHEEYNSFKRELGIYMDEMTILQKNCWRRFNPEDRFRDYLKCQQLIINGDKMLEKPDGEQLTFSEAKEEGLFNGLLVPFEKLVQFVKVVPKDSKQSSVRSAFSSESSLFSYMSSEEAGYLKKAIGCPLKKAIAEIIMVKPKDPIHYLGHWLFKYRYNSDMDVIKKREKEELNNERKKISEANWKKFIEGEVKAALLEMILRAEQIAYENELRRIEAEMAAMGGEGENE